jgi:hypothetical protein
MLPVEVLLMIQTLGDKWALWNGPTGYSEMSFSPAISTVTNHSSSEYY